MTGSTVDVFGSICYIINGVTTQTIPKRFSRTRAKNDEERIGDVGARLGEVNGRMNGRTGGGEVRGR